MVGCLACLLGLCAQRVSAGCHVCGLLSLNRLYVDVLAAFFADSKYYCAINQSVDGVVLAQAHVLAGVVLCATLTLDDIACLGELTAKDLHAESFAF